MRLSPNKEAIAIFNSRPPAQWPRDFTEELRLQLLRQKAETLKESSLQALLAKLPSSGAILTRPYPALPEWIYRKCMKSVDEIICEVFSREVDSQTIARILNERVIGERFGTDWHDGGWRIVAPPSQNRLFDLMGLSHELGHILAEEPRQPDFAAQVRGEALALSFEVMAVASQLNMSEQMGWRQYCRETDNYNFEFFRREFSGSVEVLQHPAFIFRESLWTSHGYQAVYAAASLVRQTVFKAV